MINFFTKHLKIFQELITYRKTNKLQKYPTRFHLISKPQKRVQILEFLKKKEELINNLEIDLEKHIYNDPSMLKVFFLLIFLKSEKIIDILNLNTLINLVDAYQMSFYKLIEYWKLFLVLKFFKSRIMQNSIKENIEILTVRHIFIRKNLFTEDIFTEIIREYEGNSKDINFALNFLKYYNFEGKDNLVNYLNKLKREVILEDINQNISEESVSVNSESNLVNSSDSESFEGNYDKFTKKLKIISERYNIFISSESEPESIESLDDIEYNNSNHIDTINHNNNIDTINHNNHIDTINHNNHIVNIDNINNIVNINSCKSIDIINTINNIDNINYKDNIDTNESIDTINNIESNNSINSINNIDTINYRDNIKSINNINTNESIDNINNIDYIDGERISDREIKQLEIKETNEALNIKENKDLLNIKENKELIESLNIKENNKNKELKKLKENKKELIIFKGIKFEKLKFLGSGATAQVFLVTPLDSKDLQKINIKDLQKNFALKIIYVTNSEMSKNLINEIKLMQSFTDDLNSHVIKLFDYEIKNDSFQILMEAGEMDLWSFLSSKKYLHTKYFSLKSIINLDDDVTINKYDFLKDTSKDIPIDLTITQELVDIIDKGILNINDIINKDILDKDINKDSIDKSMDILYIIDRNNINDIIEKDKDSIDILEMGILRDNISNKDSIRNNIEGDILDRNNILDKSINKNSILKDNILDKSILKDNILDKNINSIDKSIIYCKEKCKAFNCKFHWPFTPNCSFINSYAYLSVEELKKLLEMLFSIFEELATKCIIHRDIKHKNFVFINKRLKLIDFGLSRKVTEELSQHNTQEAGTYSFMSPESILNKEVSRKSDIWALGNLIHEIIFGELKFKGNGKNSIFGFLNSQKFLEDKISVEVGFCKSECPCKSGLDIFEEIFFNSKRSDDLLMTINRTGEKIFYRNLIKIPTCDLCEFHRQFEPLRCYVPFIFLIRKCLVLDPKKRFGIFELRKFYEIIKRNIKELM